MEAAAATFVRPDGPAAQIRTGDRDAFVFLYGPDFDGLFDFVLRSVRDRASAAVALSDALHQAWDIFRERGAPYDVRGWLFVIARDAVLARPRRRTGMSRSVRDSSTRLSRPGSSPTRRWRSTGN